MGRERNARRQRRQEQREAIIRQVVGDRGVVLALPRRGLGRFAVTTRKTSEPLFARGAQPRKGFICVHSDAETGVSIIASERW